MFSEGHAGSNNLYLMVSRWTHTEAKNVSLLVASYFILLKNFVLVYYEISGVIHRFLWIVKEKVAKRNLLIINFSLILLLNYRCS
ncbi:MAG: hypothetical protein COZ37_01315 [bacterium (Candidatus Ratteibacteria) CG_4_10_14_3_um_filter_41_18]|uniref:Uncharacterized protein n=1 Tax=bacterium (Candidatus Ratteibacteria) CG_4_10_14_3_um_filter_41_18 TaxID=2014287 RepID=A0A2M7M4U1_9BACT|nr:MAG: hypothetical protein COZ37_01315 [bacterium (Candidatus Ratteibacteria) CG_4_10_14_3_um_filter_41_18]